MLARRGANQPRVGDFNQTVVVDAIRRAPGGLSRVELAAATGLAAQTVSTICRRLLDAGLAAETGKSGGARGKPRTILQLRAGGRFAVGVHLDPAVITSVLLDLTGAVVAQYRLTPPPVDDPAAVIAAIAGRVHALVAGVEPARVLGTGIAAPGPVDLDRGMIVGPPNLTAWHEVPLRDALRAAIGMPVLLDKDVTAAAVAEMWAGAPGTFLVLYLGTGLGAGLVLNGDVVRGASGNAGELGHIVTDPDGAPCPCGLRGCVAVTVTPQALVTEAVEAGLLHPVRPGPHVVDAAFTLLCARAAAAPGPERVIVERSAQRLARAVAVMANLFDVDRVVLGGPSWNRLAPVYGTRLPALLDAAVTARAVHSVDVVGTAVGDSLAAIGAASLVLDAEFSPRPNTLVRSAHGSAEPSGRRRAAGTG